MSRQVSFDIALLFAASYAISLGWLVGKQAPFPIVNHHNIKVMKQVAENQWWMSDDEDPKGFLYTACRDFPNGSVIWEGYVAREARWQEQGRCKSIQRHDLGFWWSRDEQFNARRITE